MASAPLGQPVARGTRAAAAAPSSRTAAAAKTTGDAELDAMLAGLV